MTSETSINLRRTSKLDEDWVKADIRPISIENRCRYTDDWRDGNPGKVTLAMTRSKNESRRWINSSSHFEGDEHP